MIKSVCIDFTYIYMHVIQNVILYYMYVCVCMYVCLDQFVQHVLATLSGWKIPSCLHAIKLLSSVWVL